MFRMNDSSGSSGSSAEYEGFEDASSTISFMENMYTFFQLHNVSSRSQYIRSLDSHIAPYVNVSDERLQWLKETFTKYIDEVQIVSANVGLQGFSKETAHALQFTAIRECRKNAVAAVNLYAQRYPGRRTPTDKIFKRLEMCLRFNWPSDKRRGVRRATDIDHEMEVLEMVTENPHVGQKTIARQVGINIHNNHYWATENSRV
ncbi:hypothetical protein TcasGA2_TC005000 [Tribolium castaneum]|uniref:DUF4817 domain-containing protein n=1 Tax=Tribolium castaneum TaxID=7070 RepID=D6WBY4_TRICA|nr:hypothetical protein TcasGA2_TC005000 [Tribolium castaneum]